MVISGNEKRVELMEMTWLVMRQLPVAVIEVPIFHKRSEQIGRDPGETERQKSERLRTET